MSEAEVEELPMAIVRRRLIKDKHAQIASSGDGGAEVIVNKDAMAAFAESARIFIHYLSTIANDMCMESKRQIINADDILKVLDEMEFPQFVEAPRTSLLEFRNKNAVKRSGTSKKQAGKRRNLDEESLPQEQIGSRRKLLQLEAHGFHLPLTVTQLFTQDLRIRCCHLENLVLDSWS